MLRISALLVISAFLLVGSSVLSAWSEERPERPAALFSEPIPLSDSSGMPRNNELCILCHLYFDDEPITEDHVAKGVTCAHCHGLSEGHMHDETMMTSPDIMWGRKEVEKMCGVCHGPHKNPTAVEAFRTEWGGKKRENGRSINRESICTDCHGLHTIARR